jgi:hypothetical protein
MGKTVIEKIIQNHTADEVAPGKVVWLDLDVRSARDFGGPNVVKNYERHYAGLPLENPGRTFFTFDLCAPACTLKYADNQQVCRDFARQHGIRVFDVDRGVGTHVLMEEGLVRPGGTAVGTDSHMNILGAVGAFGQGMGDVDITFGFRTGRTWFEVPKSVKVVLTGMFEPPTSPKDLTLFLLKILGTKKIALRSAEFYGPAVAGLSLAGRLTLCSMVTEMAGMRPGGQGGNREVQQRSLLVRRGRPRCRLLRGDRDRCAGASAAGRCASFTDQRPRCLRASRDEDRFGFYRLLHERPDRGFRRRGRDPQRQGSQEGRHAQDRARDSPRL